MRNITCQPAAGDEAGDDATSWSAMAEVQACRKRWREALSSENMHRLLEERLRNPAPAEPIEGVRRTTPDALEAMTG